MQRTKPTHSIFDSEKIRNIRKMLDFKQSVQITEVTHRFDHFIDTIMPDELSEFFDQQTGVCTVCGKSKNDHMYIDVVLNGQHVKQTKQWINSLQQTHKDNEGMIIKLWISDPEALMNSKEIINLVVKLSTEQNPYLTSQILHSLDYYHLTLGLKWEMDRMTASINSTLRRYQLKIGEFRRHQWFHQELDLPYPGKHEIEYRAYYLKFKEWMMELESKVIGYMDVKKSLIEVSKYEPLKRMWTIDKRFQASQEAMKAFEVPIRFKAEGLT